MKNYSSHKLNFFERITDPMRFSGGGVPPQKLLNFILHFSKQIKSTIFLLFILQLLNVLFILILEFIIKFWIRKRFLSQHRQIPFLLKSYPVNTFVFDFTNDIIVEYSGCVSSVSYTHLTLPTKA